MRAARCRATLSAIAVLLVTASPSPGHTPESETRTGLTEMSGRAIAAPGEEAGARARAAAAGDELQPTPRARCGPGSNPEPGMQGRVPADAVAAGKADAGFTCNTRLLAHHGSSGGFKVQRYVDRAGRECAYYDTTLLFPSNAQDLSSQPTGAAVLDMGDPTRPQRTDTLLTPAMRTPHGSRRRNERRGLLVAVMGNQTAYPGHVDIYEVS